MNVVRVNPLAAMMRFVAEQSLSAARFLSDGKVDGMIGTLVKKLKYGENPYQQPAGLYSTRSADPLGLDRFRIIEGRLGFVNLTDLDRLIMSLCQITRMSSLSQLHIAVAVKHGNPCGAAVGKDSANVLRKVVTGDPLAVFGGYVMTNFPLGKEEADILLYHANLEGVQRRLLDGVIAPMFFDDAVEVLSRKGERCSLISNESLTPFHLTTTQSDWFYRVVRGGFLRQSPYRIPSAALLFDAMLAWAICSTSNSNTVTLVRDGQLIGNGCGGMKRVMAAKLAIQLAREAGHETKGATAASDAFFPFTDGPEVLAEAGISRIVVPSGSVRDGEIDTVCEKAGIEVVWLPSESRGFCWH